MPVLFRIEEDLFREAPFVDILVNPVNCLGAMGKGLAKEFGDRYPEMLARYKELCAENKLTVGKIYVYKDEKHRNIIVNLPTKVHWIDDSDVAYIRKGLIALRRYLEKPGHQHYTVTMPMLGCGYGNLEQDTVKPLFEECLEDLPNVICVTQREVQFPRPPKILVLFGSRLFAAEKIKDQTNLHYQEQLRFMEEKILETLSSWGMTITDFDAVVSGGADGADKAACGTSMYDPSYDASIAYKLTKGTATKVVIAKADWDRFGKRAGFVRNEFMADLGTHFIGFLPGETRSPGTEGMIKLLEYCNKKVTELYATPETNRFYKNLKVWGRGTEASSRQLIV